MLTAIKIKNFRLFESLEVKRLGRVTLLVGKNNAGKSSFLEALLLYLNRHLDIFGMVDLIEFRQDTMPFSPNLNYDLFERPIRHAFTNHIIPKEGKGGIVIDVNDFSEEDRLKIFSEKKKTAETTERSFNEETAYLVAIIEGERKIVWSKEIEAIFSKQVSNITRKSSLGSLAVGMIFSNIKNTKFQFIPTYGTPDLLASWMWDAVSLTDDVEQILSIMRIIEPKVEKISFVGDESVRVAKVRVSGVDEPVTLRTLGDGVTKLFHILISIAYVKDGTLLIDEFENGFHWSVQEKVWTAVFDLAEKLNVQVFATTHSRDCVQAFSKVWSKNEEAGAFIRLENNEGMVRAEEYDSDMLATSIRADVEVR